MSEEASSEGEQSGEASSAESEDLVEQVAAYDEELADAVDDLYTECETLRDELAETEDALEEMESRLKRTHADFENYKKRMDRQQETLKERASEEVVERLLDVKLDLKRAVEAEEQDVESLREGVRMTLRELDRIFDAEGVVEIRPEPGTAVDPHKHEVMLRRDSEFPEDTIAEVFEPGFMMGERVLRPAKVTVSEGQTASGPSDEA